MSSFIQGLFAGYGLACFILLINYLVTKQRLQKMEQEWLDEVSNIGHIEKVSRQHTTIKKLI